MKDACEVLYKDSYFRFDRRKNYGRHGHFICFWFAEALEISEATEQMICYIYSGTCLIRHTKGPGKCVGLYRMSEYSSFILLNIIALGP